MSLHTAVLTPDGLYKDLVDCRYLYGVSKVRVIVDRGSARVSVGMTPDSLVQLADCGVGSTDVRLPQMPYVQVERLTGVSSSIYFEILGPDATEIGLTTNTGGGAPVTIEALGEPYIGVTVRATYADGWRNTGGQWSRNGVAIGGATALDFTTAAAGDHTWVPAGIPFTPTPIAITAAAATKPTAPAIGTMTAGDGTTTVNWTLSSSNGGSPVTGHEVELETGQTGNAGASATSLAVTASNGVATRSRVRAVNAVAPSDWSGWSNQVTPQASVSAAIITADPVNTTIETGNAATFSFTATGVVTAGWQAATAGAPDVWTDVDGANTTSLTTGALNITDHQGRRYRGFAIGTDGQRVYTQPAAVTITNSGTGPMPEPAVQSMLLQATQLVTRVNIIDNGGGTYTGTDGTESMVASMSTPTATPHLGANADGWTGIEWRGTAAAACLSSGVSQNFIGGRWLVLRATGVYWRDAGVETKIENVGAVGTRYRIGRFGTALRIDRENVATGEWVTGIYTFAAVISATVALHACYRTSNGVIKPLNRYGIDHSAQSQWIEPGFISIGTDTFVSTAGTLGEIKLTRLLAAMQRGATQTVAAIPPPDDHNRAAVIEALSGKLVVAYTGHGESAFYTNRSSSVAGLDFLSQVINDVTPNTVSYAQLFRAPGQTRIWRMNRNAGALNGVWHVRYSDNEGDTWLGAVQISPLPYQWGVPDETGTKIWITAYRHPTGSSPNHMYLYGFDLLTGDVLSADGAIVNNVLSGSGNPRMPLASMQQILAADGAPASTRLCDVREGNGTTGRAVAFIRFNKGAANTGPNLCIGKWNGVGNLYTEAVIRGAGPAFHFDSAYYPAHCFGANENEMFCAYSTSTALGGADQVHILRKYTSVDNGVTWTAGPVLRQITGIISRPRYHNGVLYWSELSAYATTGNFSFKGDFCWLQVG